jgi:hypothetical protein
MWGLAFYFSQEALAEGAREGMENAGADYMSCDSSMQPQPLSSSWMMWFAELERQYWAREAIFCQLTLEERNIHARRSVCEAEYDKDAVPKRKSARKHRKMSKVRKSN